MNFDVGRFKSDLYNTLGYPANNDVENPGSPIGAMISLISSHLMDDRKSQAFFAILDAVMKQSPNSGMSAYDPVARDQVGALQSWASSMSGQIGELLRTIEPLKSDGAMAREIESMKYDMQNKTREHMADVRAQLQKEFDMALKLAVKEAMVVNEQTVTQTRQEVFNHIEKTRAEFMNELKAL